MSVPLSTLYYSWSLKASSIHGLTLFAPKCFFHLPITALIDHRLVSIAMFVVVQSLSTYSAPLAIGAALLFPFFGSRSKFVFLRATRFVQGKDTTTGVCDTWRHCSSMCQTLSFRSITPIQRHVEGEAFKALNVRDVITNVLCRRGQRKAPRSRPAGYSVRIYICVSPVASAKSCLACVWWTCGKPFSPSYSLESVVPESC